MASFGRKPAKGAIGGSSSRGSSASSKKGTSESFRKLMEEEEEREKFAREFSERSEKEEEQRMRDEADERVATEAQERTRKSRKGGPNPEVFLEVEIRNHRGVEASGRMDFELFADILPVTAENFRCLCTGEKGKDLHFKKSIFHRIVRGFMAQGGDITKEDGTGGMSIYGRTFRDEGFPRRHERPGALSMANSGRHTNNSQFFVLFKAAPHLDNKHVVFGKLIGEENQILKKIEAAGSESGDVKGEVIIKRCGQIDEHTRPRERSRSPSRGRKGGGGGGKGRDLSGPII